MDFTGKCALVTGATGGIGRVIVKKLHDAGGDSHHYGHASGNA